MYPDRFSDIDVRQKGNEISEMFFGKAVFDDWLTNNSFQKINIDRIK